MLGTGLIELAVSLPARDRPVAEHGGGHFAVGVEDLLVDGGGFGRGVSRLTTSVFDADGGGAVGRGVGRGDAGAVPGDVEGIGDDEEDVAIDAAGEDVFAGAAGRGAGSRGC